MEGKWPDEGRKKRPLKTTERKLRTVIRDTAGPPIRPTGTVRITKKKQALQRLIERDLKKRLLTPIEKQYMALMNSSEIVKRQHVPAMGVPKEEGEWCVTRSKRPSHQHQHVTAKYPLFISGRDELPSQHPHSLHNQQEEEIELDPNLKEKIDYGPDFHNIPENIDELIMAQVLGPNWKQAIESHTEANEKDERYQRMLEENIGTDQVVLNDHDEFVVLKGRPYQPPPSYRPTTRKELLRLLDESFFEWKIKKRGGMPKRNMNSPSFPLSRTDVYEEEYEIDHGKKRQLHKWILQSENRDYHRHLQRVRNRAAGVSKRKAPRNAKLGKARSHWDDTHWSHSAGGREELSSPERELDTLSIYNNSTFDNKEHQSMWPSTLTANQLSQSTADPSTNPIQFSRPPFSPIISSKAPPTNSSLGPMDTSDRSDCRMDQRFQQQSQAIQNFNYMFQPETQTAIPTLECQMGEPYRLSTGSSPSKQGSQQYQQTPVSAYRKSSSRKYSEMQSPMETPDTGYGASPVNETPSSFSGTPGQSCLNESQMIAHSVLNSTYGLDRGPDDCTELDPAGYQEGSTSKKKRRSRKYRMKNARQTEQITESVDEMTIDSEQITPNTEEIMLNTDGITLSSLEISPNIEEMTPNDEETTANEEESTAIEEETTANEEETTANEEETTANEEESTAIEEETTAIEEENMMEAGSSNTEQCLPPERTTAASSTEQQPVRKIWPLLQPVNPDPEIVRRNTRDGKRTTPSSLGSRIKRKKQVKTQLTAVPKAQTEVLNKIREKFDIRQGPDPQIERGNLLRITPEGDFALLQPFNPLQHDYSPQIGPYTVCTWMPFLKEQNVKHLEPCKYLPIYGVNDACAVLPLSPSLKPTEAKLLQFLPSGFFSPFPNPLDEDSVREIGRVEVDDGEPYWYAYQLSCGIYYSSNFRVWLFEDAMLLSRIPIHRSQVWPFQVIQITSGRANQQNQYGFNWLLKEYRSGPFKNLFEGGPDEAMMNRLNENPIKFREKFIGKVEIQGWVYLNWRALQGALGGSKLDPQVLIAHAIGWIAYYINELLKMSPELRYCTDNVAKMNTQDAIHLISFFFYGLGCIGAEYWYPYYGRQMSMLVYNSFLEEQNIRRQQEQLQQ